MQTSLIDQGLDLMLFGMGTVFIFLTILVFATALMSRVVRAFSAPALDHSDPNSLAHEPIAQQPSPEVLEAIKLALIEHRRKP